MLFVEAVKVSEIKYEKTLERLAGREPDADLKKVSPTQIEVIHHEMIERFGGKHGIRDNGLFLSLCENPYQFIFGAEIYPTIFDKAAKYLENFTTHQVFVDGNKRTAFSTMVVFLAINGYDFEMDQSKAEEFVMKISTGKYKNISEIAQTILSHCILRGRFDKDIELNLEKEAFDLE